MTGRARKFVAAACVATPALVSWPPSAQGEPVPADRVAAQHERPPPSGADEPWTPFEVIEQRLANGVRVLMVQRRDLPIVRIGFVIKRGTTDGDPGVATCAMAIIRERARSRALRGVGLDTFANYDATGLGVVAITRWYSSNVPAETFMDFRAILSKADVTAAEWEQVGPDCVYRASADSVDADTQVHRREHQALYPPEHPYRQLPVADETEASAMGPEAIRRFLQTQVQPDQLVVVAVGDIARESLWDSIRNAFQSWKGQAAPRKPLPEPVPEGAGGDAVTLLDQPGLSETRTLLAARGVPWQSPDYVALALINEILGGSFSSRLNLNLREHNTYSYGASSEFGPWRGEGPLEAHGAVVTEHTADAMAQILVEINRLRTVELTQEELARVKRAAIRRIPLMAIDLVSTLRAVSTLGAYDRPANDYAAFSARIQAVTAADIARVARKYLAKDRLHWFLIADAAAVAPSLTALHLGTIRIERLGEGTPATAK